MSPAKLEKFKKRLLEQADAVTNEIDAHRGPGSASSSEVENAIVSSDDKLLEKIQFALKRIEDGSYGSCVKCQKAIAEPRLDAKPAVSLCTSCQEEKERGESQN